MSPRLPSLTSRELLRALGKAGFYIHHQTGSHATMKHSDDPSRRVTVPVHSRELRRGTLTAIVKQTGLTVAEFVDLL